MFAIMIKLFNHNILGDGYIIQFSTHQNYLNFLNFLKVGMFAGWKSRKEEQNQEQVKKSRN